MKAGVSTKEIDHVIHKFIVQAGAKPSFLGYGGFPASACISLNDRVIHGIPSSREILKEGDVVSVDVGAYYNGFHGDNAYTFRVGEVSPEADQLLRVTEESLTKGIAPGESRQPGRRYFECHSDLYGIVWIWCGERIYRPRRRQKPARGSRGSEFRKTRKGYALGRRHDHCD